MTVRLLTTEDVRAHATELGEVLADAVAGGASVSYMAGFGRPQAAAYFEKVAAQPERLVFAAGDFDGTAQLWLDMPPNQPHRAELAKMLVHRRARRRGLGRALFAAVEAEARRRGRTLLTFDTMSGSAAEKLYLSCGCVKAGEIPRFALLPEGGEPAATSVFFKLL